jgi:hypothetical protein
MSEGRRACRGSVPALAVGLLSLSVALGIACHAVAQFSGGEELMEDSSGRGTAQRGAMAGARAAGRVQEPRVGQVLTRVEQDGSGHDGDQPLVTDKTVRQAMATIKGRNIKGMATAADRGKLQQLRYTGRYADTSYVVNAPEGDPATVTAHNSIWPSVVHRDQPYIEQVSSGQPLLQIAAPRGSGKQARHVPFFTHSRPRHSILAVAAVGRHSGLQFLAWRKSFVVSETMHRSFATQKFGFFGMQDDTLERNLTEQDE